MKKIILSCQLLILVVLLSCIQNNKSNNSSTNQIKEIESISIPFHSITFSYLGKSKKNNQTGKIIFEQNRIIMQSDNSKEAFDIRKISLGDNMLSFQTQNNKNEKASFNFSFSEELIKKVTVNMFDLHGTFEIGAHSVSKSNLFTMYKTLIQ